MNYLFIEKWNTCANFLNLFMVLFSGSKYAMIVMKSIAANLLRNFHFTTPLKMIDLKVRLDINIFLENGHMVQAYHRDF